MMNINFLTLMAALFLNFAHAAVDTKTSAGTLSSVKITDLCNYTKNYTYGDLFDLATDLVRTEYPKLDLNEFDLITSDIRNGTLNKLGGNQYHFFSIICGYILNQHIKLLPCVQILQPIEGNVYEDKLLSTDLNMAVELFRKVARQAKERQYGNIA
ncbi:MAG: hypothetical protein NEHIOOID_01009 [Holosporales bacterium]